MLRQRAVIKLLQEKPGSTGQDIAGTLGISKRQAERIKSELKETGFIKRVGTDKELAIKTGQPEMLEFLIPTSISRNYYL